MKVRKKKEQERKKRKKENQKRDKVSAQTRPHVESKSCAHTVSASSRVENISWEWLHTHVALNGVKEQMKDDGEKKWTNEMKGGK